MNRYGPNPGFGLLVGVSRQASVAGATEHPSQRRSWRSVGIELIAMLARWRNRISG